MLPGGRTKDISVAAQGHVEDPLGLRALNSSSINNGVQGSSENQTEVGDPGAKRADHSLQEF